MSTTSRISWTDKTWGPTIGCSRVPGEEGCLNCYAEGQARRHDREGGPAAYQGTTRLTSQGPRWTGRVNLAEDRLEDPLHWRKPCRVFVDSMSDLYHDEVPDDFIVRVYAVMAACPQHTFQVLTKRPERRRGLISTSDFVTQVTRVARGFGVHFLPFPLANVWEGVSASNQKGADERIPVLLATRAAVRWLSAEPLLGPMIVLPYMLDRPRLDWVVAGGESGGRHARPMHVDWARSLRDQCVAAGVPYHLKQHGIYRCVSVENDPEMSGGRAYTHPDGGRAAALIHERGPSRTFRNGEWRAMRPGDRTKGAIMLDEDTIAVRMRSVHAAGRDLDGRTWDQYPC